jgi:hypothetical protein
MECISKKTGHSILDKDQIEIRLQTAICEITRKFCWVYRDWQSAIGDEMLVLLNNSYRYFDVIGFAEFTKKKDGNRWIKRVESLFSNLDVSIGNRFDTRVRQIKGIYISLISLIETLNSSINDYEGISKNSLETLSDYRDQLTNSMGLNNVKSKQRGVRKNI